MSIMTYQTLVGKESRYVVKWWRWAIVVILFTIIVTSFIVTFSFHSLLINFNSNCILNSEICFEKINPMVDSNTITNNSNLLQELNSDYQEKNKKYREIFQTYNDQLLKRKTEESGKALIYKIRSKKTGLETDEDFKRQLIQNEKDLVFFVTQSIDESNSKWNSMTSCDYFCFVPFVEAIVALIWLTLFVMCGRGGRSNQSFVEEPWRIVLPALVFFTIMLLIAFIYLIMLHTKLINFCMEFKSHLNNTNIPCSLLINKFSLNHETLAEPATNFLFSIVFSWITGVLWMVAVLVMCLRCSCASDFQLINVTIFTVEDYEIYKQKANDQSQIKSDDTNDESQYESLIEDTNLKSDDFNKNDKMVVMDDKSWLKKQLSKKKKVLEEETTLD